MKSAVRLLLLLLLLVAVLDNGARAQQKLAQTGLKFLSVTSDARAAALGEAYTAVEGSSQCLFFNPAGIAGIERFSSFAVGQTRWIADINHFYGSVAISPFNGEYGVIGVFVQSVDYGALDETIFATNSQGFTDLGTFNPRGLSAGIGYARALSSQFSVGGVVKYVRQDLGTAQVNLSGETSANVASAYAFDFGILYKTGFKSLTFGMTVRNFSRELRFVNEGFQLPLTFRIGLAMNVLDLADMNDAMQKEHAALVTLEAEHPRDYAEQLKVGVEYTFMQTLSLRIGYIGPADEHGVSYGVGLQRNFDGFGLGIDYAYTPFGVFTAVHRFNLQFAL